MMNAMPEELVAVRKEQFSSCVRLIRMKVNSYLRKKNVPLGDYEDICQEVAMSCWVRFHRFEDGRGSKPSSWIGRAALMGVIDACRSKYNNRNTKCWRQEALEDVGINAVESRDDKSAHLLEVTDQLNHVRKVLGEDDFVLLCWYHHGAEAGQQPPACYSLPTRGSVKSQLLNQKEKRIRRARLAMIQYHAKS
jgi:DNA-directed RNA polymerase specialized sigma24 family protein